MIRPDPQHSYFLCSALPHVGPRPIVMVFETCLLALVTCHEEHQFNIIAGPDVEGSYLVQIPLAEVDSLFTDEEAQSIFLMMEADEALLAGAY